ncbi:uncharacterized protein LOC107756531 [Sinocyclocheilus rhinocerous]|uniref:uncharacterized protein LOC107756531 n=1 Tax=Sinocyclocheilus rhinocerous TaxID=307959 RepID=UPI0007BAC0EB|nr:PREDICTED: uncharacterized protein LOC107756531 [Sinocyclocheilus rhinocerous]
MVPSVPLPGSPVFFPMDSITHNPSHSLTCPLSSITLTCQRSFHHQDIINTFYVLPKMVYSPCLWSVASCDRRPDPQYGLQQWLSRGVFTSPSLPRRPSSGELCGGVCRACPSVPSRDVWISTAHPKPKPESSIFLVSAPEFPSCSAPECSPESAPECSPEFNQEPTPEYSPELSQEPAHFTELNQEPAHFTELNQEPVHFTELNQESTHFSELNQEPSSCFRWSRLALLRILSLKRFSQPSFISQLLISSAGSCSNVGSSRAPPSVRSSRATPSNCTSRAPSNVPCSSTGAQPGAHSHSRAYPYVS